MVFPYATVWSLFQRASQTKRKLKVMVLTIDSETAAPGGGARRFHVWAPRATSRSVVTPTSFSPQVVEVAEDELSEVCPVGTMPTPSSAGGPLREARMR